MNLSQNPSMMARRGTVACVDTSYVVYHIVFSSVNKWTAESPHADVLEELDTEDPSFQQVDITKFPDFMDILIGKTEKTVHSIMRMVEDFNGTVASTLTGPVLFVLDPPEGCRLKSWRYLVYDEYKGQRQSERRKKPFDVSKVCSATKDVLMNSKRLNEKYSMSFVFADGCEADDIIATCFMDERNKDHFKFLIASDKDYLQLENVTQMTLEGKQVEIEQPYPDKVVLTPSTYLLAKIITGDTSDNITQVFNRVGYKTAVKKYVGNLPFLTESLENDRVAREKFMRNTTLIDFKRIPSKIRSLASGVLGFA